MRTKIVAVFALLLVLLSANVLAHPGSGIVVDKYGQVYFTDTGKGVWKIDTHGKLIYLPASRFHWMSIDPMGFFAHSPASFGNYFERVTSAGNEPSLVMCSDFPLVVGRDGNIYYADTRPGAAKIMR